MKIFLILLISLLLVAMSAIQVQIGSGEGPSYGIYVNGEIYVIAQSSNMLQVVRGSSIIENYSLPSYSGAVPFRIAYLDGYFYIVYQKGPVIKWNGSVISTYNVPQVGKFPSIISTDNYVVVTASYGDKIYVISPGGNVTPITVMNGPQALAYDNLTNIVYVGGYDTNLVYGVSLNTLKVVYNFTLNDTTVDAMTFIPPDELAIATYDQQVEIINATTGKILYVFSIPTFGVNGYSYMIYVPANDSLYLSVAHKNDVVAVMNLKTHSLGLITVGNSPNGIVYDPENHEIYVMNYGSNTISVIPVSAPSSHPSNSLTSYYILALVAVVVVVALGVLAVKRR
ncbi:YncE family protein [Metallosphaera javensis (ex Sakai et al. 2022)]|uniref:YncE family protein n=1 Tax=Metallosphaera javensis (ex Sakai et al. 2022) TaxID=2775498 RepID=UPI002582E32C|nr:MAG: hypothetical protein MjAS7_1667 [Metallosphaera javensis (ex Sakai et al. 2022)]